MRPIQESHRALRRHDRERLKNKRRRHHGLDHFQQGMEKRAAKTIDTPTPCSCPCCGNPRKYFGEASFQERKFFQADPEIHCELEYPGDPDSHFSASDPANSDSGTYPRARS